MSSRLLGARFKAIAFKKDNSETSSFISVTTNRSSRAQDVYSTDKNQYELHLWDWNFVVKNTALKSQQKIQIESLIARNYKPCHHWYDKERGLVFSPIGGATLMVQRISLLIINVMRYVGLKERYWHIEVYFWEYTKIHCANNNKSCL